MRIWDIEPSEFPNMNSAIRQLFESLRIRDAVISKSLGLKAGWTNHPEVLRWAGKLNALRRVFEATKAHLLAHGKEWAGKYHFDVPGEFSGDSHVQDTIITGFPEQRRRLEEKDAYYKSRMGRGIA